MAYLPKGEYLIFVAGGSASSNGDFSVNVTDADLTNYAEFIDMNDQRLVEWWGGDCGDAGELTADYGYCEAPSYPAI